MIELEFFCELVRVYTLWRERSVWFCNALVVVVQGARALSIHLVAAADSERTFMFSNCMYAAMCILYMQA